MMINNQYTNTVLSKLHEIKSAYQKNIMIGMIVSIFLSSVFAGFLIYMNEIRTDDMNTSVVFDTSPFNVSDKNPFGFGGHDDSKFGYGAIPSLYSHHSGFSGFNGYEIVPEQSSINIKTSSANYVISIDDVSFGPDLETTTANGMGGYFIDDGIGDELPEGPTLIEIASNIFPHRNQHVEIMPYKPDIPAFIKITEHPRHPEKAWQIDGLVVIEFIIRKNGNITDINILSEEPPGLGFGRAVLGALDEALCWPAKIKEKKVDTKITLTWTMCWGNWENRKNAVTYSSELLIVLDEKPK